MEGKDLIQSSEFWLQQIQLEILRMTAEYMENNHVNIDVLCERSGLSRRKMESITYGDGNISLAELAKLSVVCGKSVGIVFEDLEKSKID